MKILYYDFMFPRWLPMEAAILKNTENNKIKKLILLLKCMHTHILLTHLVFVCYANNHFVSYFIKFVFFSLGIIGKNR